MAPRIRAQTIGGGLGITPTSVAFYDVLSAGGTIAQMAVGGGLTGTWALINSSSSLVALSAGGLMTRGAGAATSGTPVVQFTSGSTILQVPITATVIVATLPANTVLPAISPSGTPVVGVTLTATSGTWTGDPVPTYAYQWRQVDTATNISGATSATYTPVAGDVGHTLTCVVTATNIKGPASASAATTPAVISVPVAPVNTVAPGAPTGPASVGATLTAQTGTWTGNPAPTFTYAWYANGVANGATGSTYVPVSGDIGKTVTALVTGSNVAGTPPGVMSAATAAIVSSTPGVLIGAINSAPTLVSYFKATVTTPIDVFLFMGYSNMLGWNTQTSAAPARLSAMGPQAIVFDAFYNHPYVPLDSQIGPEGEFAYNYLQANPTKFVAVGKSTVNGTSLAVDWNPSTGGAYSAAKSNLSSGYSILSNYGFTPTVKAVFWALGGIDAGDSTQANAYQANLTAFIAAVRAEANFHTNSSTPFIFSRITPASLSPSFTYADVVRAADYAVAMAGTNVRMTDTDGYPLNVDQIHYTTAGQVMHGDDFWTAYNNTYATAPTISGVTITGGSPQVGSALTAAPTATGGKFPGVPTAYQWAWADTSANISGATSASYTPVSGDVGHTLKCTITVTNQASTASATSSATATVASIAVPTISVAPALSTTSPQVGVAVTVTTGTWTGTPTSYTYQWIWADTSANISGATTSSYTPVSGDTGHTLKCAVTATNAGGSSTPANSNTSSAVSAASSPLTWNPTDKSTDLALTNSNRDVRSGDSYSGLQSVRANQSKSTGKWYVELNITAQSSSSSDVGWGLSDASAAILGTAVGAAGNSGGLYLGATGALNSGYFGAAAAGTATWVHTQTVGDVYALAVDFDAGKFWVSKNNTWSSGSPSAGTSPFMTFTANSTLFPAGTVGVALPTIQLPATNTYSPPSGFTTWNG